MRARWATFDCYGTLIDWDGGIRAQLERLFGVAEVGPLLECYHELEPLVQAEKYRSYAEVLTLTLMRLAEEEGLAIPEGETDALPRSLPDWRPFPEAPGALEELRGRGFRLAILSNSDRDLLEASRRRLGVPFDAIVAAEDVGSYKPAHAHWERFFAETSTDPERHVHVGASLFHDVAPASELGLRTIWINRLGESARPKPTRELANLTGLADAAEALVPG